MTNKPANLNHRRCNYLEHVNGLNLETTTVIFQEQFKEYTKFSFPRPKQLTVFDPKMQNSANDESIIEEPA